MSLTDGVARLWTSLQEPGSSSVAAAYSGDAFRLLSEASYEFATTLRIPMLGGRPTRTSVAAGRSIRGFQTTVF